MRYLILLLFLLPLKSFSQISFVSNLGKPDWAAITMLLDTRDANKSLIYYTSGSSSPALISPLRDTTLSGLHVASVKIGNDPNLYFVYFDGMSSVSLYNKSFQLIRNFPNDSYSFISQTSPKPPTISPDMVISAFKLLLML